MDLSIFMGPAKNNHKSGAWGDIRTKITHLRKCCNETAGELGELNQDSRIWKPKEKKPDKNLRNRNVTLQDRERWSELGN